MPYVVAAALVAWMIAYGRHARREGERLAAEAQAAEIAEARAAEAQAGSEPVSTGLVQDAR
jgi:hypothetical protein